MTSRGAVVAALIVDVLVAVGKIAAFLVTGSVSLLAEALHSIVDVVNQGLLAVGIARSRRPADPEHPYGFGRSRYVWAMLSAAGVLFLGSGMALVQGAQQLLDPSPLEDLTWGFVMLGISGVAEGVSLTAGLLAVQRAARAQGVSWLRYVRRGDDPTAVAVIVEDGVAVLGVALAATAIALAQATGNPRWDGAGSVTIGLLLAAGAVFLIDRNRHLLLDPSPSPAELARVVAVLEESPAVERISDVKATRLGAGRVRFKAEVTFDGRALAARLLADQDVAALFDSLERPGDLEALLVDFGDRVVGAVGDEVDRIEAALARSAPEVRHVDLEPEADPPVPG